MKIICIKISTYLLVIIFGLISPSLSANCGRVTITEMNWPSAQVTAHIDKYFLTEGFNCDVTLVPGDTIPSVTSMIGTGEPSVVPEVWIDKSETRTANIDPSTKQLRELLNAAQNNGLVKSTGRLYIDGVQDGFWISADMLKKHPELESIRGVLDHPELFPHPDMSHRSAFYGCPRNWRCHTASSQLYQLYELLKYGFDLITPESGDELAASISNTYDEGKGWFGYYWQPTAPVGKYDLVKVRLLAKGQEFEYTYRVETYVSNHLLNNQLVMSYFSNRAYTSKVMSQLLSWKEEMGATTAETVDHFLKDYHYLWINWVDPYIASIIKSSIK